MKFQKQLFKHDPENGIYGDCWRTVIACTLNLEPQEVPHFNEPNGGGIVATHEWLKDRGYCLIQTNYDGSATLESVLMAGSVATFYEHHYFLSGFSKTGCNHVVICKGDEIVWDTSLTNSGIVGPQDNGFWSLEWIVKE